MASKHDIVQSQGVFKDLLLKLRLIARLMMDRRVPFWPKLLPIGALAYAISPVDFIMGIPGVDAIDDVFVLWLGATLFIEMCPKDVVAEITAELNGQPAAPDASGDVIDGEVTDVSNNRQ